MSKVPSFRSAGTHCRSGGTEPATNQTERVLMLLAADQRASLERGLYGLTAPPTLAEAARISADKLLIYQALLDAVEELPEVVQPGILIDEQYGAGVAELAGRSSGAVTLAMPLEASGQEWFAFAYARQWERHARFFALDFAKVLIRDNPGFEASRREQQARRLSRISAWAAASDRPLIIELLVPPTAAESGTTAQEADEYDLQVRPGHAVQVIEYLQDHAVEPAIWKLEGLDRVEDASAVVASAHRDGRLADCIVLGRHVPRPRLEHWLEVAAQVPGFVGFAIGRSIWYEAIEALLHHECSADEARRVIGHAYLDYARHFLAARGLR